MTYVYATIGFLFSIGGWLILFYIGWRNQRAAKDSLLVDDTNFGPRMAAIVETALHPDHAATWYVLTQSSVEAELRLTDFARDIDQLDELVYLKRVFPALGQDSSEQFGIRADDGEAT